MNMSLFMHEHLENLPLSVDVGLQPTNIKDINVIRIKPAKYIGMRLGRLKAINAHGLAAKCQTLIPKLQVKAGRPFRVFTLERVTCVKGDYTKCFADTSCGWFIVTEWDYHTVDT